MVNNARNTRNTTGNQNEYGETPKSQRGLDPITEAIIKYIEFKQKEDPKFYFKIKDGKEIFNWKTDFLNNFKGKKREYDSILPERINNSDYIFEREIFIYGLALELKIDLLLNKVLPNETSGFDKENVRQILSEKTKDYLDLIIKNSEERKKFINENNLGYKEINLDFLSGVDLANLTEEQKTIFAKIQILQYVSLEEIREIFSLFDTDDKKLNLLKKVKPVISLAELNKDNSLDDNTILEFKKKVEEKLKSNNNLSEYQKNNIDELINKQKDSDIIDSSLEKYGDVPDKFLNVVANEMTEGLNDISSFINKIKTEGKEIELRQKGIDFNNFVPGDILEMDIKREDKNHKGYFRIDGVNDKEITITNLTQGKGIIKGFNEANLETGTIAFADFINLLKDIDKGKIVSSADFEEKVKNKEIREIISGKKIETIEDLTIKLDEIDKEGSQYQVKKGMSLYAKDSSGEVGAYGVFSISKIEKDKITITNGLEEFGPFSFVDFFSAFRDQDCHRISSLENPKLFLDAIQNSGDDKINKGFEDIRFENDKFVPKAEKDNKEFKGINYFVGKDGKAIFLEEIKGNRVKLSIGDYKEGTKKKVKKNGKEVEIKDRDVFSGTKGKWCGLEILYKQIKEHKALPKIPELPVKEENAKVDGPKLKNGFFTHYISGISFFHITKGVKQFTDSIKAKLEQGNKVNSAKVALGMGKLLHLPKDVLLDLQSSMEDADRNIQEEIVKSITRLSTKDAVIRITAIITNPGSPQYEKRAAMVAALKKLGSLYPGNMKGYRGSFLWYKAFGGKINDEFFLKTKNNIIKAGKPFNEEGLMLDFFRVHYEKVDATSTFFIHGVILPWREGKNTNKKNGEDETEPLLTVEAKIQNAVNHLADGEYYHAIGTIKNVWNKGGTSQEMNKLPFLILMSGIARDIHQEEVNNLRNSFIGGNTFVPLWFLDNETNINLFKRVLLKLCKNIPGSEGLLSSAMQKNTREAQIKALANFWDSFGAKLCDKLNMTKDPEIFLKKEEDSDFKDYFESIQGIINSGAFNIKDEHIQNEVYNYDHSLLAIVGIEEFMTKGIRMNSYGKINSESSRSIFNSILDGLKDIRLRKDLNNEEKLKLFEEYHRGITLFLIKGTSDINRFKSSEFGIELSSLGLSLPNVNNTKYCNSNEYYETMEKDFLNFMTGKSNGGVNSVKNIFEGRINEVLSQVKTKPTPATNRSNNNLDDDDDE